ncbi:MAG: hypothetical protein QG646_3248 [Euryarchaeota archaeon]|nr:hypothetical protein [Euryarchaeota archaeon]
MEPCRGSDSGSNPGPGVICPIKARLTLIELKNPFLMLFSDKLFVHFLKSKLRVLLLAAEYISYKKLSVHQKQYGHRHQLLLSLNLRGVPG